MEWDEALWWEGKCEGVEVESITCEGPVGVALDVEFEKL